MSLSLSLLSIHVVVFLAVVVDDQKKPLRPNIKSTAFIGIADLASRINIFPVLLGSERYCKLSQRPFMYQLTYNSDLSWFYPFFGLLCGSLARTHDREQGHAHVCACTLVPRTHARKCRGAHSTIFRKKTAPPCKQQLSSYACSI